jgi:hypothetical protein
VEPLGDMRPCTGMRPRLTGGCTGTGAPQPCSAAACMLASSCCL